MLRFRAIRHASCLLPVVALVLALLAPASASAATSPYGHMTITYRNASTYKWQVTEAFAAWGRAGTPFRFVPARPRTRADITITQKPYIGAPNSAVAGYGGIGYVQLSVARLKSAKGFHNGQVRIVAHEIGHALGLGHSANRCAIMFSGADYPTRPPCATPEVMWDGRQPCGPRAPDMTALARMWHFTPRAVAWRGYCTTPQDPAKAATGPYVAGTLTGAPIQFPYEDGANGIQLTLTNTGNTEHEIGSYGVVVVDAAGAVLTNPWANGQWYHVYGPAPAPGQSTTVVVPGCRGEYPILMRVRLASQHHDAFLSPEVQVRLDTSDGDPAAPASECVNAA